MKNERYQNSLELAKSLNRENEFNNIINSLEILNDTLYHDETQITDMDEFVYSSIQQIRFALEKSEIDNKINFYETELKKSELSNELRVEYEEKLKQEKINIRHVSENYLDAENNYKRVRKSVINRIKELDKEVPGISKDAKEQLNIIQSNLASMANAPIKENQNENIQEKNRNYDILNNMKEIMNNNDIIKDIEINEKDINNKFKNIINIYNKMNKKEEYNNNANNNINDINNNNNN